MTANTDWTDDEGTREDFPSDLLEFPATVPPPPQFGTVLDAPPPSHPLRIQEPISSRSSRAGPWIVGFAAFVVIATSVGFLLGNLGADDADLDQAPGQPAAVAAGEGSAPPTDPPLALADNGPCPAGMVEISGGKLFMGTDRDIPVLAMARPAHQVELGAYCIGVHEVTVDEYRACSDEGECKRAHRNSEWPGSEGNESYDELCNERYDDRGRHPMNCVTWVQAQRYCEQHDARLPTEAEWEMAARGSDGRVYPWGDELPDAQHMNGCGAECRTWRAAKGLPQTPELLFTASDRFPGTAPVGSFPAGRTQWGLDDIAGNVFEWTADPYRPYPGAEGVTEPEGDARRVIRGGAFNSFLADHADPALRFSQDESAHTHGIGFRCAAALR